MLNYLRPAELGYAVRAKLGDLGFATRLLLRLISLLGPTLRRARLLADQIHFLGNHSLAIITVSGLFVGFVLGLQGYYILQRYGSSEALGLMAVDPVRRVLAPRFWGGVIAMPLLAAVFSAVGILGGYLVGVVMIGVDAGAFWSQMQNGVDVWKDVGNGLLKSVVFGIAVTFIALLQGYECQPTPEGVSRATTRTVVMASLAVLGLDFVLTAMMFSL